MDDLKLPGEEDAFSPLIEEPLERFNGGLLAGVGFPDATVSDEVLVHCQRRPCTGAAQSH